MYIYSPLLELPALYTYKKTRRFYSTDKKVQLMANSLTVTRLAR